MADSPEGYTFSGGYPTAVTIQPACDDADLNRAVQCYRFFDPSVSITATWRGNVDNGVVPNQVFPLLEGTPQQLVFTPNSDTPYSAAALDLTDGPMVVELSPGPLMCASNDLNQRWITRRTPLRPDTSARWREPPDQDHSGVRMVRLLPHLRTRRPGL